MQSGGVVEDFELVLVCLIGRSDLVDLVVVVGFLGRSHDPCLGVSTVPKRMS